MTSRLSIDIGPTHLASSLTLDNDSSDEEKNKSTKPRASSLIDRTELTIPPVSPNDKVSVSRTSTIRKRGNSGSTLLERPENIEDDSDSSSLEDITSSETKSQLTSRRSTVTQNHLDTETESSLSEESNEESNEESHTETKPETSVE